MKRKIFSIILCLSMILTLTGCDGGRLSLTSGSSDTTANLYQDGLENSGMQTINPITDTVSFGVYHSAVIKSDASLWHWGNNSEGQVGDGTLEERHMPVKIMEDVVDVSLGDDFSAAVKRDGSLWVWGKNGHGQIGDGTTEGRYIPVKIMDDVMITNHS